MDTIRNTKRHASCVDKTKTYVQPTKWGSPLAPLLIGTAGVSMRVLSSSGVSSVVIGAEGLEVGPPVGVCVGVSVGVVVGAVVGAMVGFAVGAPVGVCVGASVGVAVGAEVGAVVGSVVGASVSTRGVKLQSLSRVPAGSSHLPV
mgnify:CR=1 FL=1